MEALEIAMIQRIMEMEMEIRHILLLLQVVVVVDHLLSLLILQIGKKKKKKKETPFPLMCRFNFFFSRALDDGFKIDNLKPDKLTHINYAFANAEKDGSVVLEVDIMYPPLI
jgi:GH18 family chitinase